jgi:hypothetical protein
VVKKEGKRGGGAREKDILWAAGLSLGRALAAHARELRRVLGVEFGVVVGGVLLCAQ